MMAIKPWYEREPLRYLKELEIINKRVRKGYLYNSKNGTKCLKGLFQSPAYGVNFLLEFPKLYPYQAPKIWLYHDSTFKKKIDYSETYHQNYDNSICLFTSWGSDSWHFSMNLTNVFDRLHVSLIRAINHTHIDVHTSMMNYLPGRRSQHEIYVPTEILYEINRLEQSFGSFELHSFTDSRPAKLLLLNKENSIVKNLLNTLPWKEFQFNNNPSKGIFVKIPIKVENFRKTVGNDKDLYDILPIFGYNSSILGKKDFIFFLFTDSKPKRERISSTIEFDPQVSFLYDLQKSITFNINKLPLYTVYEVNIPNDCFQRTYGVLDKMVDELRIKNMMLIGLGTLGSTIALELAKTGVFNFILYDNDIFQPVNVCRHIGTLKDLGRYKTEIIHNQITNRNPEAKVKARHKNPFENKNIEPFIEELIKSDLVITTIADHGSHIALNKLALDYKIPVIYGWCGSNAVQGRIFRVIPSESPCYNCINLQLEHEPEIFPRIKKPIEGDEVAQVEGYRQPGIPGISIDINFIALFIARFALQTLLRNNPNYPDAEAHHYLWQNWPLERGSIGNLLPTAFGEFRKIPNCPICGFRTKISKLNRSETRIKKFEKKFRSKKLFKK